MTHQSPLSRKLIKDLHDELGKRNWPIIRMVELLNSVLEESRQLINHTDNVKLYGWMNVTHPDWCVPSGEIILAMKLILEKLRSS